MESIWVLLDHPIAQPLWHYPQQKDMLSKPGRWSVENKLWINVEENFRKKFCQSQRGGRLSTAALSTKPAFFSSSFFFLSSDQTTASSSLYDHWSTLSTPYFYYFHTFLLPSYQIKLLLLRHSPYQLILINLATFIYHFIILISLLNWV